MSLMKTLMAVSAIALLSVPAYAQTQNAAGTAEVNQRLENQQQRIDNGVNNGSLTPNEAAHLEKQQTKMEDRVSNQEAKNGGELTNKEVKKDNKRLNKHSKRIHKKKHNARTAH